MVGGESGERQQGCYIKRCLSSSVQGWLFEFSSFSAIK